MEATVKSGAWTGVLPTGRAIAPGSETGALRRQQALGVLLE
ncbi:MAG TPA: hypothetical protein VG028_17360 [Terriglobia bacterium]|nr:hypothetical protein [Terriglobia bacterium]